MAEDYLTDDEQVEQIKRVFAENWVWIVAGAVLGVGLWFGWTQYRSHNDQVAMQASVQFGAMTAALAGNDLTKSRQIAEGLIKDYPKSPYADQANLTLARLDVDDGKLADALGPLTVVMNDSKDSELRHIARLRLARIFIDQGKADEAIQTLAAVPSGAAAPGAFAARYHEVRGDAYLAKQDRKGAAAEYKAALASGETGAGQAGAGADAALLELKLADVGDTSAPIAIPTVADSSNKAKP